MNKEKLLEVIRQGTESFDEAVGLIRTQLTATYHTALKRETTPEVHFLLTSAEHAYYLLEEGEPSGIERAIGLLEKVVPLQDRNPASDTYGVWPYFYEEPLEKMDRPDWNMADFHGKRLILTLIKHEEKLGAELAAAVREAIGHACRAIMKRNVGPHYTNIAIMGAFVTLAGGELLGNDVFREYGLARLKRFYDFTFGIGTFSEYNSPCYTPIAIKELHSISAYSSSLEAAGYADELMDLAWRMAGEHYHAGTGQWSGPHSRTYSSWLRADERQFLEEALLDETFEFGENIRCPLEHRRLFLALGTRTIAEPTLNEELTGYQVHATLYRNESLSLGTFSKGLMWNQRRNLIAYLKEDGRTSFVQLQFLKDGADFCSAMFAGAQSGTDVLFGLNLLTDNGAWHSDLDIINGRFRSSDLRIRFKIGGAREGLAPETSDDGRLMRLGLGSRELAVRLLAERSDYGRLQLDIRYGADSGHPEADGVPDADNRALYVDYVLYAGEERDFDFHEVKEAAWMFQLALLAEGEELAEPVVEQSADAIGASLGAGDGRMSVTFPVAPGETRERLRNSRVRLPIASN
ncbi:MAG: hypothetical protein K0Q63_631 [Paenibacillus sp.]|nr:hypothetical protein [Paenibacillus sp.]